MKLNTRHTAIYACLLSPFFMSAFVAAQTAAAPSQASAPNPPAIQMPPPPPSQPAPSQQMPVQQPPMTSPQRMYPSMPPMPPQPLPDAIALKPARNVTLPATIDVSGIAAVVNGVKITNDELVTHFLRNGGQPSLQELILQTEVEQAAAKAHVAVTDDELASRLKETKKDLLQHYTGQTWAQLLASKGLSEDYAIDSTKLTLLLEKLAVVNQPYSLKGKIRVSHILIATQRLPDGSGGHTDAEALAKIQSIAADITAGKITFANAAKEFSEDASCAPQGGDLGWISQQDPLDPAFKAAAFQLKLGQISGPVKSQFGYHLIDMTGDGNVATPAQVQAASDLTLEARARPLVGGVVQQIQSTAKVENLLIPQPPAQPAQTPQASPIMIRPQMAPQPVHPTMPPSAPVNGPAAPMPPTPAK